MSLKFHVIFYIFIHRKVRPLLHHAAEAVSKQFHNTLIHLDSIWIPPPLISPGSTPTSSPSTSPISGRSNILPPLQIDEHENIDILRQWLFQLPPHLIDDVVRIGKNLYLEINYLFVKVIFKPTYILSKLSLFSILLRS